MAPSQVLERVQGALRQSGVEYNQLPARVQQQLQREAATALRSGRDLDPRSEEHTSELQSLMRISYAVFCLKKKIIDTRMIKKNTTHQQTNNQQEALHYH